VKAVDVLVAGGGNAGICAALTARAAGASVLVLEAAPKALRGGNSRHTRNMRCQHDAPLETLEGNYSSDEYLDDLQRVTHGKTDLVLARIAINESPVWLRWLRQHGVRFQAALGGTLQLSRTNAFFLGGGKALLNSLYAAAEQRGIEIRYGHKVTGLDMSAGGCNQVHAESGGNTETFAAKAVVAAAGGFEANLDWLEREWGEAARNFIIRGTPYNTGGVLRALLDGGARPVGDPRQCHAIALDARAPKFDGGIATRLDSVSLGIVVNLAAERFYDEGEDFWPKRYAIWGRLVAQQPEQIAYSIIDQKVLGRFMPSLYPPLQADSIAALARALELDPDRLSETVSRYNAAVRQGSFDHTKLDDCRTEGLAPPKSHWALPLDRPPYLAYPLRPGITFTYLGVAVDQDARVQFAERCDNVYAAGEVMAGNVLGEGYLAGIGMTIGGVFGCIAGRNAARHAHR
jgi:tricarballylate dehydrogenase